MTGAGAPGAAGILKCLWQDPAIRVSMVDANPNAVGRYLNNDDFEKVPLATDPRYIDAMLAICRKKNIHIVLPLVTRELIPLANHIKGFEIAGSKVLVSPSSSLEIANNKSRMYVFLDERGIKVPDYRIVRTIEEFSLAASELGFPANTICFKPSVSNGSRGFRIINSFINEADLLFNEKPNSTYITMSEAYRILSSAPFPELLVSEYLPGEEFSVDCLTRNGETILAAPRSRLKMVNGISVEGEFTQDVEIIDYCTQINRELQLHGNIGIQLKKSAEGKFLILEINPRVQGTVAAALGAGINFPVLAVKQELGLPILPEELYVNWGTKFSRYWSEVFYH